MVSSVSIETCILVVILSLACISMFILAVIRLHLTKERNQCQKEHVALLINPEQIIKMMIPFNKSTTKAADQQSIRIQTETLHLCVETNEDYHESILCMNDNPCYPVRETIFQLSPTPTAEIIRSIKTQNYANEEAAEYI